MRLDTSGNLGIGTTSPTNTAGFSRQLQISGTTAALTLTSSTGGSNYSLGAGSAGDFGLWNNTTSSYRWYVDSSGNVGIGTSNPAAYGKFTVFGTGYIGHFNSTSGSVGIGFYESGTGRFYIKTLNGSDGLAFIDGDSTTEHMRIDASGNVGIGTSSAAEALEISRTTDPKIRFVDVGNLDAKIGIVSSTALGFEVNGSERARIDSSGNLGIGTTAPRGDLDVGTATASAITKSIHLGYSAANFYGFRLVNTNTAASFAAGTFSIQRGSTASWTDDFIMDNAGKVAIAEGNAPTQVFNIYRSGSTQTVMSAGNSNTGLDGTWFGVDTAGNGIVNVRGAFPLLFSTNALERARIDASGNLQLGGTTKIGRASCRERV
jgi:hypothetical protein